MNQSSVNLSNLDEFGLLKIGLAAKEVFRIDIGSLDAFGLEDAYSTAANVFNRLVGWAQRDLPFLLVAVIPSDGQKVVFSGPFATLYDTKAVFRAGSEYRHVVEEDFVVRFLFAAKFPATHQVFGSCQLSLQLLCAHEWEASPKVVTLRVHVLVPVSPKAGSVRNDRSSA